MVLLVRIYLTGCKDQIGRYKDPGFLQLLREAVHFYFDYTVLSYQARAPGQSGYKVFEDYNSLTPGVQLFQLPALNNFILSHPLVLKSFNAEEDNFNYLEQQFGYSKIQLESGKINVVGTGLATSPNIAVVFDGGKYPLEINYTAANLNA